MNDNPIITTSWDDGHPLDFRIAELLVKYGLQGTFYIPKQNPENEVMIESRIRELSMQFEIGGHTMNHISANQVSAQKWDEEVNRCYAWLTELTGKQPVCFCFPRGIYTDAASETVFNAGFKLARTTELMNISKPTSLKVVPTTIQIYDHSRLTYFKHLVKRRRFANLFLWMRNSSEKELDKLTDKYVKQIVADRGYLHLWGHSWEIEKFGLWTKLENVFKRISGLENTHYVPNKFLADAQ